MKWLAFVLCGLVVGLCVVCYAMHDRQSLRYTLVEPASFGTQYQEFDTSYDGAPPEGCVPDAETAVRVAVAVSGAYFGEKQILKEQPFVVTLSDDVWVVRGTLHGPTEMRGGVVWVVIAKQDGRILRLFHTR